MKNTTPPPDWAAVDFISKIAYNTIDLVWIILIFDKMACCHFILPCSWQAAYSGKNRIDFVFCGCAAGCYKKQPDKTA